MATTLLVSDVHLDTSRPGTTELFINFLEARARIAKTLFVLGDLFEAWVGDDDDAPLARETIGALNELVRSGTRVSLIRGNRDFLIGERFARESGCSLLPSGTVVNLAGQDTLLMHGDELCTDDVDYQKMRTTLGSRGWQHEFLAKPLTERRKVACVLREGRIAATARKSEIIMDVNHGAVANAMNHHRVGRLIHGHTHRPGRYEVDLGEDGGERFVLADWHPKGSVLAISEGEPPRFEDIG